MLNQNTFLLLQVSELFFLNYHALENAELKYISSVRSVWIVF